MLLLLSPVVLDDDNKLDKPEFFSTEFHLERFQIVIDSLQIEVRFVNLGLEEATSPEGEKARNCDEKRFQARE